MYDTTKPSRQANIHIDVIYAAFLPRVFKAISSYVFTFSLSHATTSKYPVYMESIPPNARSKVPNITPFS